MSVPLTLACERYDRTEALRDGRVPVAGVDLTYLPQQVEETFFRMARFQEFDVAEMSLSSYAVSLSRGAPFVAIPVFPSRFFRHSGIYVSEGSGIRGPADLVGKRVGMAEYQLTANVWIRGILAEHHGVPVDSVSYHVGGLHEPGRIEKISLELPAGVRVEPIPEGRTLSDMLANGELDAIHTPRAPHSFSAVDGRVRRLFDDPGAAEVDYFRTTGIFPIMHVVVLRREVYERNRWLARSLFDAFAAAKRLAEENFRETATLRYMLPWLLDEVDRTKQVLGDDYWPYGLADNEHTLAVFLRYHHEQGLSPEPLLPRDLFAPETLEVTRV
jgi:4,5-dihydroxyphthalate decarboxylase